MADQTPAARLPITLSGDQFRAVFLGSPMTVRYPIEPQPKLSEERLREQGAWINGLTMAEQLDQAWRSGFVDVPCPYGEVGEVLDGPLWAGAGDVVIDDIHIAYTDCWEWAITVKSAMLNRRRQ